MSLVTEQKEKIYNEVKEVVKNSLELDEQDFPVSCTLTQLNKDTDGVDMLDIYYRLGLEFMNHTSGEKLNEKGIRFLEEIAEFKLAAPCCKYAETSHFYDLARSKTIKEYINQLTIEDLIEIKEQSERLKLISKKQCATNT